MKSQTSPARAITRSSKADEGQLARGATGSEPVSARQRARGAGAPCVDR